MPSSRTELPEVLSRRWITKQRGPRNRVDPRRPYALLVEPECGVAGAVEEVATVFLSNRECPFQCLMCDLWKNTTEKSAAPGWLAEQVEWALHELEQPNGSRGHRGESAPTIKLYNSGNFFDPKAIPPRDLPRIAELLDARERLIVECHPKLVDQRCLTFQKQLLPRLEVALGLETVDPEVLPRLNKGMTLDDFAHASSFLREHDVDVRAFVLLRTPWQSAARGIEWALRSLQWAFDHGVQCCAVVPTRGGNGAMERLEEAGVFAPPDLGALELVLREGLALGQGRVFVDLWDLSQLTPCQGCQSTRGQRLQQMNLQQRILPGVSCNDCGQTSL
jgi:hypothetical protein